MTLILSVILCLFFKAMSCQPQCVKETPNDTEFSINVTTHVYVEAGDCIFITCQFTFPKDKVTIPYEMIWFQGDPQNVVEITTVDNGEEGWTDTVMINGLPHGEYEYGFKVEWECGQYIFPKRVPVSVSALTKTPAIEASPMTEGESKQLSCQADTLCGRNPTFYWEWTKADGQTIVLHGDTFWEGDSELILDDFIMYELEDILYLTPTADDHNTNITCVADYGDIVSRTTVTLAVKFPPTILNGSQCMVEGEVVVCVCISWGNPPPPITWPLDSLTDYSVTSSSLNQIVNSTITMPAADYNTSIMCTSSNELGQDEMEILLQNYTENSRPNLWLDGKQKSVAALPWIVAAGVSFSLNIVLLTSLILCTYKRSKRTQKNLCEEMNTYATLNRADLEEQYSVIGVQPK